MASNVPHKRNTIRHLSFMLRNFRHRFTWRELCCIVCLVLSIKLVALASHFNRSSKFSDDKLIVLFEATKTRIYSFAHLVHLFGFLQFKPNKNLIFPPSPPKVASMFPQLTQNKCSNHFITCSSNVFFCFVAVAIAVFAAVVSSVCFCCSHKNFHVIWNIHKWGDNISSLQTAQK